MIWRKIKTHWLLSGLFLLFACFCFGFWSSSKVLASESSLIFESGTTIYGSNYTGPFSSSYPHTTFTGEHVWSKIVSSVSDCMSNSWGCYNSNYVFPLSRYQGISYVTVTTQPVTATGEYASIHFEFNYVTFQPKTNAQINYLYEYLNNLTVLFVQHTYSAVPLEIVDSNLNYYLTDWNWNVLDPPYGVTLQNTTLTFKGDLTVKGLTSNVSDKLIIGVGTAGKSFIRGNANLVPNQGYFGNYFESGYWNVQFFSDQYSASNATTNNILNQQLYYQNYQHEQDLEDRSNIENRSSDATTDGDNASANAQTATSSLLSAITGIYNQLLHPSITSCRVFGVQVYELNLGTLDFCTGFDMPAGLMAIGSIGMIGLVLLLGWSVLHATISLYNDLFGGKK